MRVNLQSGDLPVVLSTISVRPRVEKLDSPTVNTLNHPENVLNGQTALSVLTSVTSELGLVHS